MNNRELHQHVGEVICTAWRKKDYELLRSVLADILEWYEGPFDSPQRTVREVVARWEQDVRSQSNIRAAIATIEMVGDVSFQRCKAYYELAGKPKELDGIFRIQLDTEGKINRFEQWWASR